jgi:nucleoside 2-deoxyribosyltransferase
MSGEPHETKEAHAKIYVASSWHNPNHDPIIKMLHQLEGWLVYDYRNPPDRNALTTEALRQPNAKDEIEVTAKANLRAIRKTDVVVALLPAGASTHIEIGYAQAHHKPVILFSRKKPKFEVYYEDLPLAKNIKQLEHILLIATSQHPVFFGNANPTEE